MKNMKKLLFLASLLPLMIITSSYKSEISDRGFGGGFRDSGRFDEGYNRNYGDYGDYGGYGYGSYGVYGGYGGYGGVVYPYGLPAGGYLLPGPVDPGEDEANAIFRANEHPGE
jgi:hypothetical protein